MLTIACCSHLTNYVFNIYNFNPIKARLQTLPLKVLFARYKREETVLTSRFGIWVDSTNGCSLSAILVEWLTDRLCYCKILNTIEY